MTAAGVMKLQRSHFTEIMHSVKQVTQKENCSWCLWESQAGSIYMTAAGVMKLQRSHFTEIMHSVKQVTQKENSSKVRTSIPVLHVSLKQDCLSTLAAHRRHWKLCRLLCQTAVSNQSQHDQCCMTNAITNSSKFFVCCRLPVLAMADSVVVLMQDTSVPHANQDPELTAVSKQHT